MKSFSNSNQEIKNKFFSSDKKVQNDIYDIIKETLIPQIDNETNEKLSLKGIDKLSIQLYRILENELIREKIKILKNFKEKNAFTDEKIQ